jgi:hypothetical protein
LAASVDLRRLGLIGAAAAVLVVIGVVLALVFGPRGTSSATPLGTPNVSHLSQRLASLGLPALTTEGEALHTHQHLDLYLDGHRVAVPADVGIDATNGILSPIHSHDASGIIHIESPVVRTFTLGEFFDVWGIRLDAQCLGDNCASNGRSLSVYVDGQPYTGDPRTLALEPHQEIVVAFGTPAELPSPMPSAYDFPPGL